MSLWRYGCGYFGEDAAKHACKRLHRLVVRGGRPVQDVMVLPCEPAPEFFTAGPVAQVIAVVERGRGLEAVMATVADSYAPELRARIEEMSNGR